MKIKEWKRNRIIFLIKYQKLRVILRFRLAIPTGNFYLNMILAFQKLFVFYLEGFAKTQQPHLLNIFQNHKLKLFLLSNQLATYKVCSAYRKEIKIKNVLQHTE